MGTRPLVGFVLGLTLLAGLGQAQMTPADLAGAWDVTGSDATGRTYTGTIDLTPSGGFFSVGGAIELDGRTYAHSGFGLTYHDVLYVFKQFGATLQFHAFRFDATTGTYRSRWDIQGIVTGREELSRPAPARPAIDVAIGDDPRVQELARKIAAGSFTRAEALEFLDANLRESQDWIRANIRERVTPNYYPGHTRDMDGMVIHYTANQWMNPTLRYFTSNQSRKASSHFLADTDGRLIQVFPHTGRSWHAGSGYNHTHFGFDYVNAGYLDKVGDRFRDYTDRTYERDLPLFGKRPVDFGQKVWGRRYWMPITHAQVVTHIVVGRALAAVYPLRRDRIVTHKDASPGRRVDPGPATPLEAINDAIFDSSNLADLDWLERFGTDPDWIVRYRR